MIDLHTHSLLSDGALIPSELIRRSKVRGYTALGITDHADSANLEFVVSSLLRVVEELRQHGEPDIRVLPGVEITHVRPSLIPVLVERARKLGAQLVVVHGETIAEPVEEGTNRAALGSDIDILAHPGLIDEEDVVCAKTCGVMLEITSRKGHCLTNGHVAALARKHGAKLVLSSDSHSPGDLLTDDLARRVALGAGLSEQEVHGLQENAEHFVKSILAAAAVPQR